MRATGKVGLVVAGVDGGSLGRAMHARVAPCGGHRVACEVCTRKDRGSVLESDRERRR